MADTQIHTSHFLAKVYLAGPDVFRPDYRQHLQRLKQLCVAAGLDPLCPADDELPNALTAIEDNRLLSKRIQRENLAKIEKAQVVMANVQNFRGYEPDSGTIFECGYAVAKGIPVFCYNVPEGSLIDQVPHGAVPGHDADGQVIEDFGLGRNLMIAHGCEMVTGDAARCIAVIADRLSRQEAAEQHLRDSLPTQRAA